MARFTAPPALNCWPNAGRSAVVNPAKRKLLAGTVCQRASSFTLSDRSGVAEKVGEPETLANCHRSALRLATENRINMIGFPAISCGAYGYPIDQAAQIALKTTREFLAGEENINKVIFVLWDEDVYEAFASTLNR